MKPPTPKLIAMRFFVKIAVNIYNRHSLISNNLDAWTSILINHKFRLQVSDKETEKQTDNQTSEHD